MAQFKVETEREMMELGGELAQRWRAGDIVLLSGELGAGKTTLVRGVLESLNWEGTVRSPSFTLMQVYPTKVPVLHADLYRLAGAAGIGLEEYFEDHLCLIEWPDRLGDLVDPKDCWRIEIQFYGDGRKVNIGMPMSTPEEMVGIPKDWSITDYESTYRYFPSINPDHYSPDELFFGRDYFSYLSESAQLALLPLHYKVAVQFAEQGDLARGGELLLSHDGPESTLFRLFEKRGRDFPGYAVIHDYREKFLQFWRKQTESGVSFEDDMADEPFDS